MRWLGQSCALPPRFPRGMFAGPAGSLPAGAFRAGGAAPGFWWSQVPPGRAVATQPPGRGQQLSGLRLLSRLLRASRLLRPPIRLWLPAAAAAAGGPLRGGSEPLRRPASQLESPAADPRQLRSKIAWQTTRSAFLASREDGRSGGGGARSNLGPPKATGASSENDFTDPNQENGKKPNKSQQLKKIFKEYGAVGVTFHIGISLMSLGIFYLVVSSGVDMTTVLFKLGFDEALVKSKLAAGTSTFVLAYAVHKLFAPVRISITVVSVPFLVRYFRKIGFFKPPASNP